jgi:hypothetical protein
MKKITNLFVISCLFFLSFSWVLAQENQEEAKTTLVATVNIYEAQITSQNENKLEIRFDLSNREKNQPGVRYAVQLLKEEKVNEEQINQTLVDEKIYDEVISLSENQTLVKSIEYIAPKYLKGDFKLWLIAKNENGMMLALANPGEITLNGDNQYIEIKSDSCYMRVEGESGDKKYNLTQGLDVTKDEKIIAVCDVLNHFNEEITFTPKIETHWRSTFGELVEDSGEVQPSFTIKSQEQKEISITLPKAKDPQAYDAVLKLTTEEKEISNSAAFHYVLSGNSATIQNLTLDKNYYQKGETAVASFFWSPSADGFPESRLGGTENEKSFLNITIKNNQNQNCIEPFKKELTNEPIINYDLNIQNDCLDPSITASIQDPSGNVLDEKVFSLRSEIKETDTSDQKKTNKLLLFVIISLVAILGVILIFFLIRKSRSISIIFFILLGGLFMFSQEAKADTFYVNYGAAARHYVVNLDKSVYKSGETIRAEGTLFQYGCNNTAINNSLTVTINGTTKTLFSGKAHDNYGSANFNAPTGVGDYTAAFKTYHKGEHTRTYNYAYSVSSPPTITISAAPIFVILGNTTTINYTVGNNATSCTASRSTGAGIEWSGAKSHANGSYSYSGNKPTSVGTKTYTLACSNAIGTTTKNVLVSVINPTLSISANPTSITLGSSTTINYTVSGATWCNASRSIGAGTEWTGLKKFTDGAHSYSGNKPTSLGTKTYTLECGNITGGTTTRNVNVVVNPVPAPTCNVSYNRSSITSGESATLSWNSTNDADGSLEFSCTNFSCSGSTCTYNGSGRSGTQPSSGSGTATWNTTVNTSERCTFTARNSAGASANCSATMNVNAVAPPPSAPTLSISANPTSITLGNSTTISYTVGNNATSCTASVTSGGGSWTGTRPAFNGTHTYPGVTPTTTGTKTYTISCSNAGGTTTRNVSVVVNPISEPNQIPTATITQPTTNRTINPGQSINFQGTGHDPDGFITNYEWRLGSCTGTSLSTSTSFTRTFSTAGIYNIYLRVRDNDGAWSTNCPYRRITVTDPITIINGSCGTRNTAYPSTTTAWPTGSTYCSSGTNTTSPTFPAAGTSVSWTCAGSGGGTNANCSASRSLIVIPAPSLSISANPPSITLNNSTTISYTVGNNATSCTASVTSGGGNWTGTRPAFNGTHTYPGVTPTTAGTKTYTISCSNTGGTTNRSVSVTVNPPPPGNQPPTATINQPTGDRIINPGQSIAFQGTGHDPDGFITNYQWRSGSCTTGILLNSSTSFSYSFPTPGTYRIYFRVRDNAGAWSSCDSRTITVASIIPENGSCGTRNTTYPSSTTNWPNTSTYCSSGTNTTSPTFPAAGTSVNWTCAGSGGGTNVNCEARRDSSIINGSCGENDKSYSTTTTWPDPNEEGFCSAGTPNPLSPTFPSVGSPTSWTCNGSGGGTTANCSAQVFPPGSPKPPSGGSWGEIKP